MTYVIAATLALLCALVVFHDLSHRAIAEACQAALVEQLNEAIFGIRETPTGPWAQAVMGTSALLTPEMLENVRTNLDEATFGRPPGMAQFFGMDVITVPKDHLPPGVDFVLFNLNQLRHLPWDSMYDPTDPDYPFKETP